MESLPKIQDGENILQQELKDTPHEAEAASACVSKIYITDQ
jgi:hypothetical protein